MSERPRRVAVIGAGPSALFLVDSLLKTAAVSINVDVFDRLPTPYGLVRYGVAPDHANIKAVISTFHKTLEDPRVRFFGNVAFGVDVGLPELRAYYDAIVFAVGASRDRRLDIPGEELAGSLSATEFVAWYSGHPDAVMATEIHNAESVAVIGVGNVAIDVTRILAKPIEELQTTDIPHHVLDKLAQRRVRDIFLIGRRGPAQAKFTTKELQELGEIPGVDVVVRPQDLELDGASAAAVAASAVLKRNMVVFRDFAARSLTGAPHRIHLRFFESPVEIVGETHVTGLVVQKNTLDEQQNAVPLFETERLDVQLVFRSVGYRGVELPGVPFDARRYVIPNVAGRVVDETGALLRGLYVAGWIKRGPTGVIGTNKADSIETVKSLVADLADLPEAEVADRDGLEAALRDRGVRVIHWEDWLAIDRLEVELGARHGRLRTKLTDFSDFTSPLSISNAAVRS